MHRNGSEELSVKSNLTQEEGTFEGNLLLQPPVDDNSEGRSQGEDALGNILKAAVSYGTQYMCMNSGSIPNMPF